MFLTGALLVFFGTGVHFVANNYTHSLYFLDEYFSHFIEGLGTFLILLISIPRIKESEKLNTSGIFLIFILSAVSIGFLGFMFAVEAQQIYFYIPGSILFLGLILKQIKEKDIKIIQSPLLIAFFSGIAVSYILVISWYILFKGFPQPLSLL